VLPNLEAEAREDSQVVFCTKLNASIIALTDSKGSKED
jgi:hypothetical protein